jgi:hypothetical protein
MRVAVIATRAIGLALALFSATPALSATSDADQITPELQRVRQALDKYRDPIRAVHDGYFSTVGCVEYPKAGAPGPPLRYL